LTRIGPPRDLLDNGSPALTAAETASLRAQIDFAAKKVPGVTTSSKLTYSTCAADAGTQ
jgi:hypothetical protein